MKKVLQHWCEVQTLNTLTGSANMKHTITLSHNNQMFENKWEH